MSNTHHASHTYNNTLSALPSCPPLDTADFQQNSSRNIVTSRRCSTWSITRSTKNTHLPSLPDSAPLDLDPLLDLAPLLAPAPLVVEPVCHQVPAERALADQTVDLGLLIIIIGHRYRRQAFHPYCFLGPEN